MASKSLLRWVRHRKPSAPPQGRGRGPPLSGWRAARPSLVLLYADAPGVTGPRGPSGIRGSQACREHPLHPTTGHPRVREPPASHCARCHSQGGLVAVGFPSGATAPFAPGSSPSVSPRGSRGSWEALVPTATRQGTLRRQGGKFHLHVPSLAHGDSQLLLTGPPALSGPRRVLCGQTGVRTGAGTAPCSAPLVSSRSLCVPARPWGWPRQGGPTPTGRPLGRWREGTCGGHWKHRRWLHTQGRPRRHRSPPSGRILLRRRPSGPQKPGEREEGPSGTQTQRAHVTVICGALSPPHSAAQRCWPKAVLHPNRGTVWLERPSAREPRAPPWGQVRSESVRRTLGQTATTSPASRTAPPRRGQREAEAGRPWKL